MGKQHLPKLHIQNAFILPIKLSILRRFRKTVEKTICCVKSMRTTV